MIQRRFADSDADCSAAGTKRLSTRLWFANEGFVDDEVSSKVILRNNALKGNFASI